MQAAPQGWHSPGLGEVHNKDHTKMIYCTDGNDVASDEVASEVLNAMLTSTPSAPAQPQAAQAVPQALTDHIEQRIRTWRQRTMNRSGDCLAIDDFMSQDSIDDLVDFVCDEIALAAAPSASR